MPYIEKARKIKEPAHSLWQGDEYKALFDKCMTAICTFWTGNLQEYMNKELPDIARQIDESEANIEKLWSVSPLPEFRQELVRFYKLHEAVKNRFEGMKNK